MSNYSADVSRMAARDAFLAKHGGAVDVEAAAHRAHLATVPTDAPEGVPDPAGADRHRAELNRLVAQGRPTDARARSRWYSAMAAELGAEKTCRTGSSWACDPEMLTTHLEAAYSQGIQAERSEAGKLDATIAKMFSRDDVSAMLKAGTSRVEIAHAAELFGKGK